MSGSEKKSFTFKGIKVVIMGSSIRILSSIFYASTYKGMRMAKVNPLTAKYCKEFTLAKILPHLVATNLAKMDPLKLKLLLKRHENSKSQVRSLKILHKK